MDYQPLLPPGIHDLTEDELDNHFQSGFQNSTTRPPLIAGLKSFMNALRTSGVEFELWIDGSFTTQKENPNDIDLVAFAPAATLNGLPPQKQALLQSLFDRISSRSTFGCDVIYAPAEDANLRSYWRGWYGYDRSEQPKGIARVLVTP